MQCHPPVDETSDMNFRRNVATVERPFDTDAAVCPNCLDVRRVDPFLSVIRAFGAKTCVYLAERSGPAVGGSGRAVECPICRLWCISDIHASSNKSTLKSALLTPGFAAIRDIG